MGIAIAEKQAMVNYQLKKKTFDWKVKGTRLLKTQLAIFVDSMKKLEGSLKIQEMNWPVKGTLCK